MEARLSEQLAQLQAEGLLRTLLTYDPKAIDFYSNDYLGIARLGLLKLTHNNTAWWTGSGGSRLLAGHHDYHSAFEQLAAETHQTEAAIYFPTGYMANVGLLSCLNRSRNDTYLYDALIHASMRDGIRLSVSKSHSFQHNDLTDLEAKLQRATGNVVVAIESVYSMDGDAAPLSEMASLCERYGAALVVDEAHATGVVGTSGLGLCVQAGIKPFARIHTLGKALGSTGAVVVGSRVLKEYLVNFCRPLIYSTAPGQDVIASATSAYQLFPYLDDARTKIFALKNQLLTELQPFTPLTTPAAAIIAIPVSGNEAALAAQHQLQKEGFGVRAVRSPTVPAGTERLRICLHAFNTHEEVTQLVKHLKKILAKAGQSRS